MKATSHIVKLKDGDARNTKNDGLLSCNVNRIYFSIFLGRPVGPVHPFIRKHDHLLSCKFGIIAARNCIS